MSLWSMQQTRPENLTCPVWSNLHKTKNNFYQFSKGETAAATNPTNHEALTLMPPRGRGKGVRLQGLPSMGCPKWNSYMNIWAPKGCNLSLSMNKKETHLAQGTERTSPCSVLGTGSREPSILKILKMISSWDFTWPILGLQSESEQSVMWRPLRRPCGIRRPRVVLAEAHTLSNQDSENCPSQTSGCHQEWVKRPCSRPDIPPLEKLLQALGSLFTPNRYRVSIHPPLLWLILPADTSASGCSTRPPPALGHPSFVSLVSLL